MNPIDPSTSDSERSLSKLQPGEVAKVLRVNLEGGARQRFMEMGLTNGAEVMLVRFAPLGDPLEIRVRGYHLSLRRHEADEIVVI